MANKYEMRRRAIKESGGRRGSRSENPFAAPRSGVEAEPSTWAPPPPIGRLGITAVMSAALVVLVVLLFVQTRGHDFTVCDDNVYIYANPKVTEGLTWEGVKWAWGDSHAGNWHPLTWMSHMLDWQMFGIWQPENQRYVDSWAGGHHLVNMVLHCANAVLLFLALRLMTGALWPCLAVAALFAVHPLRAESVAWAAERKDVLCGFFWMATMVSYAVYVRRPPLRQSSQAQRAGTAGIYLLVSLLFGMALLSKSMAVTLPAVFILLDFWPLGRWQRALWPPGRHPDHGPNIAAGGRLVLEKLPWFLMVAYDCQQTLVGQDKGVALNSWAGLPFAPRALNALMSIANYIGQMFWPANLSPFYVHPYMIRGNWSGWTSLNYFEAGIGAAIVVVVTALSVLLWRKGYLAVGWFWFLGVLLPVIGIEQVGTQGRADRYTYLPMIGICLMVVWLLKEAVERWPRTRMALAAGSVLAIAALSGLAFKQVSYWKDTYPIFLHGIEATSKDNWFCYNHIGIAYDADGKKMMSGDVEAANKAFTNASQYFDGPPKHLDDSLKEPLARAGAAKDFRAAAETLDLPQKMELLFDYSADAFQATLDTKPDYDFGNNNMGVFYARKPDLKDNIKAKEFFIRAAQSNPRYADAFNNLGIICDKQGLAAFSEGHYAESAARYKDAIDYHLKGIAVQLDRASDHNNLCRVYMHKRDLDLKLGLGDAAQGDLNDAIEQNKETLFYDTNFLAGWTQKYEIDGVLKDDADAKKCLEKAILINAKARETIQLLVGYVQSCLKLHRWDDAIDVLSQYIAANNSIPDMFNFRAIAYAEKGDLNRAQEDFVRVLQIAPQYPAAKENLDKVQSQLLVPRK